MYINTKFSPGDTVWQVAPWDNDWGYADDDIIWETRKGLVRRLLVDINFTTFYQVEDTSCGSVVDVEEKDLFRTEQEAEEEVHKRNGAGTLSIKTKEVPCDCAECLKHLIKIEAAIKELKQQNADDGK